MKLSIITILSAVILCYSLNAVKADISNHIVADSETRIELINNI